MVIVVSAQEATRSRLCAAERCEQDAESGSRLCWRCARKTSVRLHVAPPPIGDTLRCCTCTKELPDDAFSKKADAAYRRYRHHECKTCTRTRRTLSRKPRTPEQKTLAVASDRARRERNRALLAELRAQTP